MRVGLIDVDGHNFPNLALMKISAWHKAHGDTVEIGIGVQGKKRVNGIWHPVFKGLRGSYLESATYDIVYVSRVFDDTYSADINFSPRSDIVQYGGTGYDLKIKLPDEIEHMCPDYSLYGDNSVSYGFCTRGCPRGCPFCCVAQKEGRKSIAVAEPSEWYRGGRIELLDPNLLACKDHMKLLGLLAETKAPININQGADCRFLTEENINALNQCNITMLHFAWDLMKESESVLRGLKLYAKYGAVTDERKRRVYVLTNFDTTHEEDLYRIYRIKEIGFDPYVMIYDKPNAPQITRDLSRWVNNKFIYRSCKRFEDYTPSRRATV